MNKFKLYLKNTLLFFKKGGYKRGGVTIAEINPVNYNERLKGKHILITGGSSGIGFAIAEACIKAGGSVIITGRREEKLKEAKEKLGERCNYLKWDVTEIEKIPIMMKEIVKKFDGRIDCLVNNAGYDKHGQFLEYDEAFFDSIMAVHVKAVYFLTQAVCKVMSENHSNGSIVMVSSHGGLIAFPHPYNLAKAAVNHFVKAVAKWGVDNENYIRCNAVCPGVTFSNFYEDLARAEEENNLYRETSRSKRYFLPEEVAEVVVFLLSDSSKCVNGQLIACDAGQAIL